MYRLLYSRYVKNKISFIVGVDEAGRGPLAGPVSVGVAVVPKGFKWRIIPGVNDSKKLSEKKREQIYNLAKELKKNGELDYAVSMVGATVVDRIGISKAVRLGILRSITKLKLNPDQVEIKLDGLLCAPAEYINQKTITKGDSKEKVIGLASIMAKVTRDSYMVRIAHDYSKYDFELHKGYGTKKHTTAIKKYGLSKIHRKSFCRNIVEK